MVGIAVHDASGGLLRIIVQVEDLTLHRASEAMLVRRESMDELTSLSNRASFFEQLDAALAGMPAGRGKSRPPVAR